MASRHPEGSRHRGMARRIRRVDIYRAHRTVERKWQVDGAEIRAEQSDLIRYVRAKAAAARRELGSRSIARWKKSRAFSFSDRLDLGEMPHPALIALPGVEALGRLARGALAFGCAPRSGWMAAETLARDLVLDGEDIVELAVVALGPEMVAGRARRPAAP